MFTEDLQTLYARSGLKRIHRHFYHPHAEHMYEIMKRADDPTATKEILKELEDITSKYDICQRLSTEPGRFRVSLPPGDIVFNRIVLLDIMSLLGKSVLHIVDKDTLFSAASVLSSERSKAVWDTFLRLWARAYTGYPDAIHDDQGPQFQSAEWKGYLRGCSIRIIDSGVESHNTLGAGERYHEYLRQVFRKVQEESPELPKEEALSIAVYGMNCTAGPNGLSPILLVFGIVPRLPIRPAALPKQQERFAALC